jgi:hypothetical protein
VNRDLGVSRKDITPTIELITAIKNQEWEVRGAISELVDNAFGEGRGDASQVVIHWYPKSRELWVLDNGGGMENGVTDLFHFGKTAGRSQGDIGKYGWGGTRAIVWLADEVQVTTLRRGKVQTATVEWRNVKDWSIPVRDWEPASAMNTPTQLLDRKHGTVIILKISRTRRFHVDAVQRELANRYAPALRHGRTIFWKTGDGKRITLTSAQEKHPTPINVTIRVNDLELVASGSAGYYPDAAVKDSNLQICYGPRVIMETTDCFLPPEGESEQGYCGVVGWVDLGEGWQDYLTSAKTSFCDDELRELLMRALYEELRPLLEQANEQAKRLQIAGLAVGLSEVLGDALEAELEGSAFPDTSTWAAVRDHTPAQDPEPDRTSPVTGERPQPTRPSIAIELVPGAKIGHCMCDPKISIQGDRASILVFLNEDDEYVRDALPRKRPLQIHMFALIVIPDTIRVILRQPEEVQRCILPKHLLAEVRTRDEIQRAPWLVRHVLTAMYRAA